MPSHDALLDQIAKAVEGAKTEAGEVNAVIEKLVLQGYLNIPEATMVKAKDGRTVRVYLWEGTPAGDFALITGPDVDGRVVSNEELQGICKVAREMPQVLVELEAADPGIEQELEETIEKKARRMEFGEIKAPPKGKKKTRVTFLAKVEAELDRLEDYLDTGDGRSTRLVKSLDKKIAEVYWPSVEWRDRLLPRFQNLQHRWEVQHSEREVAKVPSTTGRGRPKADREIYINMRFMDGEERRKFGTLKGAQRWAHEYFHASPALIEGDTARNDDGGSLTVEGATLREIFPAYFTEQRKIIEEEDPHPWAAHSLTTAEIEEAAYALGQAAYHRAVEEDRSIAPAQDPAFQPLLQGSKEEDVLPALNAWTKGYHDTLHESTSGLIEELKAEHEAPASEADMMEKLKKALAEALPVEEEEEYEYEEDPDIPEGVQPGIIEESIIVEDVPERVLKQAAPKSDAEQMDKLKDALAEAFDALDL
jgi:hypothetical protein